MENWTSSASEKVPGVHNYFAVIKKLLKVRYFNKTYLVKAKFKAEVSKYSSFKRFLFLTSIDDEKKERKNLAFFLSIKRNCNIFWKLRKNTKPHVNSQGRKVYNPDLSEVNTNIKNNFISELYCLKFFPVAFVHNSCNIAPFDP